MTDSRAPLQSLSDAVLMQRVAALDTAAFAVVYDRHSAAAFGVARRLVGPSGADDVVQEAFLGVWRSAGAYDSACGPLAAWLLQVVRNRGIDALRKAAVHDRRRAEIESDRPDEQFVAPDCTEDRVLAAERAQAAQAALAALPPDQREVLDLAYYGGLSQAEIAERLGVPLGTVKGRTRLALGRLRGSVAGATGGLAAAAR